MVNCQDELSVHLLQEEAQASGGSLSGIMLLPVLAEPNRRPWAGGWHALLGSLAQADAPWLPVVLELCFSPAVRAAHKYGSYETGNEGWGEGCSPQSSLPHYKEDSESPGVHAPHLWSPAETTTRVMDAPVFLHSEKWD